MYPFEEWNCDQTLPSAMRNSVNWYFQSIDKQLGRPRISQYIKKLAYGNANANGDLSSYWMEAQLKISPIEQVQLLTELYNNSLPFSLEHMNTVKNSLLISASESGALYGKTGTGRVNGHNVNGWFVGYVEDSGNTYIFATHIKGQDNASDITLSILSERNIRIQSEIR